MLPATKKELTHQRIVETAARVIRRSGFDGVGVADIMKEAGLTHGGFYAHFASRSAMLAEAADRAGGETLDTLRGVAQRAPRGQGLRALVEAYLSDAHLAHAEQGCPIAALGCEMARQDPEVRRAATRRIQETIDLVARELPGWGRDGAHRSAMALLARLVGAVVLARAVDDPELAAALRDATLQELAA